MHVLVRVCDPIRHTVQAAGERGAQLPLGDVRWFSGLPNRQLAFNAKLWHNQSTDRVGACRFEMRSAFAAATKRRV